jgi:hypothetical protein
MIIPLMCGLSTCTTNELISMLLSQNKQALLGAALVIGEQLTQGKEMTKSQAQLPAGATEGNPN